MRLKLRQFGWIFRLVTLWFASALFIVSISPSWAFAQSTGDSWSEPVNLSRSGVATNPNIVADSDGLVHVVWQDDLGEYMYSRFDGEQWSTPEMTGLNRVFRLPGPAEPVDPFQLANYTGPNPLFITGPDKRIFAFWINPEGRVYVSKVDNQDFKNEVAWGSGRLITPGAAYFAAAVDALGILHVAFLRTEDDSDNPPGVYYTRSDNNGGGWTKPVRLYESPYLRTLDRGEAHLSITAAEIEDTPRVYVAWDNRPRKQVLLAQSADGGQTWEQPELVAGPEPSSGLARPFNVQVGTFRNSVVLVWQNGQPEGPCAQFYKFSRDAGKTWNEPQPMLEDLLGCAQSNEFLTGLQSGSEDSLFLLTESKNQVVLMAWDGRQWSQPQTQQVLSGFEEPEIYTEVVYSCHRASLLKKQLYVVGCDQGGSGDVWVTSRDLGSNVSWFSQPAWSAPSPITSENSEMEAIELVNTDDGSFHGFFSKHQDLAIYYTYWDGELWSRITPVLELPEGEAGLPAITTGPSNELFLFIPNNRGALYFSRATSGNAATESGWSPPTRLEIGHDGEIGAVDIAENGIGSLYLAYSVPLNEARGIYLVQSNDNGTSWSEPIQVFNGATAGFDLVGAPSLLVSDNGLFHIIWKEQTVQGDGVPQSLSLFYTRSEDGGRTFSDPELLLEEPVAWQQIVADGKGNLHLLWQWQDERTTVWDQVSLDNGRSWQIAQGLPVEGLAVSIMADPTGQLHVLHAGSGSLGHWLWDGSRWESEEPLKWTLASQPGEATQLLAATVNKQGKIVVLLTMPTETDNAAEQILLYSTHMLKLTSQQPAVQNSPTATPLPPTLTLATSTPEQLPTSISTFEIEPTSAQDKTDPKDINQPVSPLAMALLPVALLLLSVLGIMIRRAARAQDP
jgi:hypothetical protein